MKPLITLLPLALFCGCTSNTVKQLADSTKAPVAKMPPPADSLSEFEKRIYLNIDEIHSGKVFTNSQRQDVFYRVLVVPQEENVMLLAENIQVGQEGGGFKLTNTLRITDDGSALPKFGLSTVDSLRFIDSVNIEGYFNHKKMVINLNELKPWHVTF